MRSWASSSTWTQRARGGQIDTTALVMWPPADFGAAFRKDVGCGTNRGMLQCRENHDFGIGCTKQSHIIRFGCAAAEYEPPWPGAERGRNGCTGALQQRASPLPFGMDAAGVERTEPQRRVGGISRMVEQRRGGVVV